MQAHYSGRFIDDGRKRRNEIEYPVIGSQKAYLYYRRECKVYASDANPAERRDILSHSV